MISLQFKQEEAQAHIHTHCMPQTYEAIHVEKSIADMLAVLKMKKQNAAMTCILCNNIFFKKSIYLSLIEKKINFKHKDLTYSLYR